LDPKLLIISLKMALDPLGAEQAVAEMEKAELHPLMMVEQAGRTMKQVVKAKFKDTVDPYRPRKASKGMLLNKTLGPYLLP
jgi:hypothetical protein